MAKPDSLLIADLLDRMAEEMRTNGDAIIAEAEKIKEQIDDSWHVGPSSAAKAAVAEAAIRLSMSEDDLSTLVRLVWNARS